MIDVQDRASFAERDAHPLRIALVTYNWPPRNASGTHRPYSWAKYWSLLGASITVLTSEKQEFDRPLDLDFKPLPNVEVREVGFTPFGGALSNGAVRAFTTLLKGLKRFVRKQTGWVLDPRDGWARAARDLSLEIADNVDLVVSTFGPRSSHVIASRMKEHNPALVWVADYRDLWSNNYLAGYSLKALTRERNLEMSTVGVRADVVVTISEDLGALQASYLGKEVWVVPNGFEEEQVPNCEPKHDGSVHIVHTGMLYRGYRDPSPLFAALRELVDEGTVRSSDVCVEFYGPAEDWLGELVANYGLGAMVKLCGRITREEALKRQRNADLLLLLESGAPEATGVLTGKIFEYIAASRPILSVGSRQGSAISRLLDECGSGVCAETNVSFIKRVVSSLVAGEPQPWFMPKQSEIARYSRKEQATQLLTRLRTHLAERGFSGSGAQ